MSDQQTTIEVKPGLCGDKTRWRGHRWLQQLVHVATRNSSLAFLDQAIVSATRFLMTVIVGRSCGPEGLAYYALAFPLVVLLSNFQEATIARPYTVFHTHMRRRRRAQFAGSVLAHHGVIALFASLIAVVLLLLRSFGLFGHTPLGSVIVAAAFAAPCVLLWEFGRRLAFAHLNMRIAVVMDASIAVVQLAGLAVLISSGKFSPVSAYGAIGVACAVVGLVWLYRFWPQVRFDLAVIRRDLRRNWSFGKWILGCQITGTIRNCAVLWIITILADVRLAGIFSACATIVLLANPVILGLTNWLNPISAHIQAQQGSRALARFIFRISSYVACAMGGFCVFLYFFSEQLIRLFFGSEYIGHDWIVVLIGVSATIVSVSLCISCGLATIGKSRVIFLCTVCRAATVLLGSVLLVPYWMLTGAVIASIIGESILVVSLARALSVFSRQEEHSELLGTVGTS